MSIQKKNAGFSGMLGAEVTVRQVDGKLVVASRPKPKPTPSEQQLAVHARLREATKYARQQMAVTASQKLYATGITDKLRSAYVVAMNDYFHAPHVHAIDTEGYRGRIGDVITVKASDDFMVTKVKVKILDPAGVLIEEGDAGPDDSQVNLWAYPATVANPTLAGTTIRAIAYDRPGNTGKAEVEL